MTTIDRAGLADKLMAADASGHADAAYWGAVLWDARHEIIAALRKLDQKGEAGGALATVRQNLAERVMPLIGPMLDALDGMPNDARSTFRNEHFGLYNTIATIRQEMEAEAAPQPAPEAGKLPSEEALRKSIHTWIEKDVPLSAKMVLWPQHVDWLIGLIRGALLSPAQPHDVPCARCAGTSWVCENHPDKAWTAEGCECGAGMPCPDCDQRRQPQPHDVPAGDGDGLVARLRIASNIFDDESRSARATNDQPWNAGGLFEEAADALEAQGRKIAELEEALLPFARVAEMEAHKPGGASVIVNVDLCRRASHATSGRA